MKKFNLAEVAQNMKSAISKHSPEILIGFGITGMLSTTVLAVKATPKALQLIEEKKREKEVDKLTVKETVQVAWKCYIPAATTAVVSTACLIGASSIHAKRNAVLATAYKIAETTHREYREKVIETLGEKKEEAIRDKIDKDKLDKNPVNNREIIITDDGDTLCYDAHSGRYFKINVNRLKRIENDLNRQIIYDNYYSLNDLYRELGLGPVALGDDLGWNLDDGKIVLELGSQLTSDDKPCVVIRYNVAPKRDYWKFS